MQYEVFIFFDYSFTKRIKKCSADAVIEKANSTSSVKDVFRHNCSGSTSLGLSSHGVRTVRYARIHRICVVDSKWIRSVFRVHWRVALWYRERCVHFVNWILRDFGENLLFSELSKDIRIFIQSGQWRNMKILLRVCPKSTTYSMGMFLACFYVYFNSFVCITSNILHVGSWKVYRVVLG